LAVVGIALSNILTAEEIMRGEHGLVKRGWVAFEGRVWPYQPVLGLYKVFLRFASMKLMHAWLDLILISHSNILKGKVSSVCVLFTFNSLFDTYVERIP